MSLDPTKLAPQQMAAILSKAGAGTVTSADIEQSIALGAPTNADGTLHIIHFVAWLVRLAP